MSTKKTTFFTNLSINSKVMMHFTQNVLNFIPNRVRDEIVRLSDLYGGTDAVSELRLRTASRGVITVGGKRLPLASEISQAELAEVLTRMCRGSLYAYRDKIAEGYITLPGGVRVGICGRARYDGGALVGISDISSLIFRIPTSDFFDTEALVSLFQGSRSGMLIYSPPGGGKTTALRSLASLIGRGWYGEDVVIIDERREFLPEDYIGCSVDILRGYKRAHGVEIALRTLSPTVMIIDEIGREQECLALLGLLNSGVRLIATAHADSLEGLKRRSSVLSLLNGQIFDTCVGIKLENGRRSLVFERLDR